MMAKCRHNTDSESEDDHKQKQNNTKITTNREKLLQKKR